MRYVLFVTNCLSNSLGRARPVGGSGAADRAHAILSLRRPPALDARAEPPQIKSRCGETALTRAMFYKAVRNPKLQQRDAQPLRSEQLGDAGARAADGRVFLDRHDSPMTRGELNNEVLVERFDEPHIDERGIQARCNLLRNVHERAESE